jgi:hypothetical protein
MHALSIAQPAPCQARLVSEKSEIQAGASLLVALDHVKPELGFDYLADLVHF